MGKPFCHLPAAVLSGRLSRSVSKMEQNLSEKLTIKLSLYLGGIGVSGHMCRRIISFSKSFNTNCRCAFSSAVLGCVNPCSPFRPFFSCQSYRKKSCSKAPRIMLRRSTEILRRLHSQKLVQATEMQWSRQDTPACWVKVSICLTVSERSRSETHSLKYAFSLSEKYMYDFASR